MTEKIIEVIESKLGLSKEDYTLNSDFREDLGCDSLDMLDLIMECEKEFQVSIPDDVVENRIYTPQDLINYIKQYETK